MRRMTSLLGSFPVVRIALRAALAVTVSLAAGCGGVSGDQASKFAGSWTFESGMLMPNCGSLSVPAFQLTGLPLVLTKVDDTTIKVVVGSAGCDLTFKVSGAVATASPGQMCTLDTGALLGVQTISVTAWTLTLGGDRITTAISAGVSAGILTCTAAGSGVLAPGTPDAGTD
ncbi:MAG: hypothetical protein JWM82_3496 [Myxococcales bacterium]|nr:hypothetical protein [Myxococcales bacterium]